jgi:hypothetical protein
MWVLVATPSMTMDACFEPRYVLWMHVMNQVMCCKLLIQKKQCVVDVCYFPSNSYRIHALWVHVMGKCMCCWFFLLMTYVSWVPTTKHIFLLHVFIINHVCVLCYWLFVGIDGSEFISLHAT